MLLCKLFRPPGHSAGDSGYPKGSLTHYDNCIPELTDVNILSYLLENYLTIKHFESS